MGTLGAAEGGPALGHFLKKLLDFIDKDMLQFFEFERFLFDHGIPCGGKRSSQFLAGVSTRAPGGFRTWRGPEQEPAHRSGLLPKFNS
jgi:hypothetical protein